MRSRIEILEDLIHLRGDVGTLKQELSQYPWDSEEPLLVMGVTDFVDVLKRAFGSELSYGVLGEWANIIECRDDIDFAHEKLQELIFELANPEINGEVTSERLFEVIQELESGL